MTPRRGKLESKQQMEMKLTPKQSKFIDEYLTNGFNATKASESAGYSGKTAREQGARLLSNVIIQDAIKLRQAPIAKKYEITRESLLKEIEDAQRMAQDLGKPDVVMKGVDLKAKMLGLNEPKKIEMSGSLEQKVSLNIKFK